MARLASVAERRGRFREERRFAALTGALASTGTLRYRRPDFLEKDTLWPVPERLVIDGGTLTITDPASNDPPRVVPFGSQPAFAALVEGMRGPLAGDLAALRRAFDVAASGTLDAWRLDLTPSEPAAAKLLRRIRLAGRDSWIDRIETEQASGDTSTMWIEPA